MSNQIQTLVESLEVLEGRLLAACHIDSFQRSLSTSLKFSERFGSEELTDRFLGLCQQIDRGVLDVCGSRIPVLSRDGSCYELECSVDDPVVLLFLQAYENKVTVSCELLSTLGCRDIHILVTMIDCIRPSKRVKLHVELSSIRVDY